MVTESANNKGDYSAASKYSRLAVWFNITGVFVGLLIYVVLIIYVFTYHGADVPFHGSDKLYSKEDSAISSSK